MCVPHTKQITWLQNVARVGNRSRTETVSKNHGPQVSYSLRPETNSSSGSSAARDWIIRKSILERRRWGGGRSTCARRVVLFVCTSHTITPSYLRRGRVCTVFCAVRLILCLHVVKQPCDIVERIKRHKTIISLIVTRT